MAFLLQIGLIGLPVGSRVRRRTAVRGVITHGSKILMVHTGRGDYKFPGGGIEPGESPVDAMIRETREEAGLIVRPETVKEYGYVHRVQKSDQDASERFIQDNFYYLCGAEEAMASQRLDDYEAEEAYTLEFVDPTTAIKKNRSVTQSPYNPMMFQREARVLELLMAEGILA